MSARSKRAQTEDFISDLLPAVVIVVIAVVIGSVLSVGHGSDVKGSINAAAVAFDSTDMFSFLHSPSGVAGYGNFADLLVAISEAYELKDKQFFEGGSIARMGSEYAECSEGFEKSVDGFFNGKRWFISVFEVTQKGVFPQKKIFECNSMGLQEVPLFVSGSDEGIRFSEAYLPASGFTAYRVLMGWKDE